MPIRPAFPFLLCASFLLPACGGSSGSGSNGPEPGASQEYQVTVAITGSGGAAPAQQSVPGGEAAQVELVADEGYRVGEISGCGGSLEGAVYTTAPLSADCEVAVSFIRSGGVSGTLQMPPDSDVDGSLNDRNAQLLETPGAPRRRRLMPAQPCTASPPPSPPGAGSGLPMRRTSRTFTVPT